MLTANGTDKARQGPEPVFSVAEELAFQNFSSVFRTGLVDPALMNAVMLSLTFAVTGGSIDRECLGYQGQAIGFIREKMSSLDEATSESTIGAILLLAGVEVRKTCPWSYSRCLEWCLELYVKLISDHSGSPWDDVTGSTSHGSGTTAARDLSIGGCLSH
jgi:hypothetical protein